MGVIVPVGEVQAVLRWASASDPEEMVSTIGLDGLGPYADADALATSLAAAAADTFTGATDLCDGWTFRGVTVYVKQDGGDSTIGESLVNISDSTSVESLPSNCALLIRKRTNTAGRSGRGRMFLPSGLIAESNVDRNGTIDSAKVTSLTTQMGEFFDAMETAYGDNPWVLFHSDGAPSTPITSFQVDSRIATQRDRMR